MHAFGDATAICNAGLPRESRQLRPQHFPQSVNGLICIISSPIYDLADRILGEGGGTSGSSMRGLAILTRVSLGHNFPKLV